MSVRSDTGPFALVPLWLLELKVTDKALRLYVALHAYADNKTGEATPSRKTLAAAIGVSRPVGMKKLDEVKAELVALGALRMEHRKNPEGGNDTNVYVIVHADPRGGGRGKSDTQVGVNPTTRTRSAVVDVDSHHQEGEGVQGGEETNGQQTLEGSPPRSPSPAKLVSEVDGVRVTNEEDALTLAVLAAFNAAAGTDYRSKYYYRGVVMRLREHPELDLAGHERIIRRALDNPWWSGDPSPAVIYGKDTVFERALNMKEKGGGQRDSASSSRRYAKE